MKYTYQHHDGDEMRGLFDSIQAVFDAANQEAGEEKTVFDVEVYDTRPATGDDLELFDGSEDFDHLNFEKDGWWTGLVVPDSVVLVFKAGAESALVVLAKLACEVPQFFNPMEVVAANCLREAVLSTVPTRHGKSS